MKRGSGMLSLFVLLVSVSAAQGPQDQYLDYFIAKVKPEKRAEFDALAKKFAAANRARKGDTWISYATEYGEQNTVYFVSTRRNYAAIDHAAALFMGSLKDTYGPAGMEKMLQSFGSLVSSSRGEIRRRRPDLSWNAPQDEAAYAKMLGEARWIRILAVRVRPGHNREFEENVKSVGAVLQKASPYPTLVSESVAGAPMNTFYIASLRGSLGAFDTTQTLAQMLGEEDYQKFLKFNAESVLSTEATMARVLPESSNVTEETAAVAPEFWRPKPPPAGKAKAPASAKPAP